MDLGNSSWKNQLVLSLTSFSKIQVVSSAQPDHYDAYLPPQIKLSITQILFLCMDTHQDPNWV